MDVGMSIGVVGKHREDLCGSLGISLHVQALSKPHAAKLIVTVPAEDAIVVPVCPETARHGAKAR